MIMKLGVLVLFMALSAVHSAPWYSAPEESTEGKRLSPVIFIPGKGGSRIEARVDKTPDQMGMPDCPQTADWARVWLDVWKFLWPGTVDCWAENMYLHYDEATGISQTAPGVEFRIPGFGETYAVEYVDDSWMAYMLYNLGGYFTHVMEYLESWGYNSTVNVHGAPYDFRFAPHSHTEYFQRLQDLIEETYKRNGNTPVTILTHSMGGVQGLYFLHTMSQRWKDRYINAFVPVNSPWKGTVVASNLYSSGYNWGISPLDQTIIKNLQRTWETGVLILPQDEAWEEGHVIVQTPKRNYTAHDYDDYFRDVDYPLGKQLYDNIQHQSYDMGYPGVDVYCIYSYGTETPAAIVYEEGEFPHGNPYMTYGPGDGTVNLRSLEYCRTWMAQKSNPDHIAEVKAYDGVPHIDLLFNYDFMQYFKKIIML